LHFFQLFVKFFWQSDFLFLTKIFEKQKDYLKAQEAYEKSLSLNKRDPVTHMALGKLAMRNKDYSTAEDYFINAIDLNPKNAESHFQLGACFQSQGREKKAYLALNNAVDLDSSYKELVEFD